MTDPRRPMPGPYAPRAADDPVVDPDPPLPLVLAAVGLAGIVVIAALGAAVSVLLTPARVGNTLVPFAVVVSVLLNIALPMLTFRMTRSRAVAALPVMVFFVVGWAMSISPDGDVLLAGGSDSQTAISYATLLLAVLAGAVTSVRVR